MAFEVMKDIEGYIKDEDLRKFLAIINRPRDKVIFNLLARTGRRVGEVLMLKTDDIDYMGKTITWCIEKKKPLSRIKNEDGKVIESKEDFKIRQKAEQERRRNNPVYRSMKPIDNVSLDLVMGHIDAENLKEGDKLFTINRFRVYQLTREYGIKAGFPTAMILSRKKNLNLVPLVGKKPLHPHHFRHTFAVKKAKSMKSPAELEKLRQWLEHSSINTTQQYLKFRMEELRDMVMEEI